MQLHAAVNKNTLGEDLRVQIGQAEASILEVCQRLTEHLAIDRVG